MRTFVIGEAAACHDGSLNKALELIDVAEDIGADAVKFQWCSDPAELAKRRRAPEYLEAYRLLAFPYSWFIDLEARARDLQLEFLCTVYLQHDIPLIAPYVNRFKVSSFEAGDYDFLAEHTLYGKPVIVSLGMDSPVPGVGSHLLHCVSGYPTPVEEINLAKLRNGFDGISDHTQHPWTGALAVAAGAEIVEFHYRLDTTSPSNPDYKVARTREAAREYVSNIRMAETMMGKQDAGVQPCETDMLKYRARP